MREIYKEIDEPYFVGVKLLPKDYLNNCKNIQMSHRIFHLKSRRKVKQFIYKRFCIRRWSCSSKIQCLIRGGKTPRLKKLPCFKDSWKYISIGLVLIFSGLKKNSIQENLSFTRGCFKSIFKVDLDKNILHLLFLLEMKKKQVK